MRQSGLLAAAAIYALDHHVARLADDHANARALAAAIHAIDGLTLEGTPDTVPTNMVFFAVNPRLGSADAFCDELGKRGVAAISMGPGRVRMVLHLDVSREQVARASQIIADTAKACA